MRGQARLARLLVLVRMLTHRPRINYRELGRSLFPIQQMPTGALLFYLREP